MNIQDAEVVLALLHHLDGSQILDEQDFLPDLLGLHASAAAAFRSGDLLLDEDVLVSTLAEVAQRHADAGNYAEDYDDEPGRPVETAPVGGDRL